MDFESIISEVVYTFYKVDYLTRLPFFPEFKLFVTLFLILPQIDVNNNLFYSHCV